MKVLLFVLAALGATYGELVEPFGSNICRLFKDGTKLRNPETCESYITCKDGVEHITSCKGKFYNKDTQKCVAKAPDAFCKDPCTKKSPFWEADPKSCTGYYECKEDGGVQGYCPDDLYFDYKQQACVYKWESSCKGFNLCDVVPNGVVTFKDEANCQKYYTCQKNKLKENVCEKTYYDVQKGCVNKSEVECAVHPIPFGICGTAKRPVRDKFMGNERTCSGFIFCHDRGDNVADDEPIVGQCPEGRFFDYKEQGCISASSSTCDYDRCEGMNRSRVVSLTKGCRNYLVCENGVTVNEEQCPLGSYFNEDSMECTSTYIKYPACS